MAMDMHEKQQNGIFFEDNNGMELPIQGDGAGTGAKGEDVATNNNTDNLADQP